MNTHTPCYRKYYVISYKIFTRKDSLQSTPETNVRQELGQAWSPGDNHEATEVFVIGVLNESDLFVCCCLMS